jgi:uncharacterized protein (TIGR02001 family)
MLLAANDPALAQQESSAEKPRRSIVLGSRGGPVGDTQGAAATAAEKGGIEFSAGAAIATDYVYRGVTLSDRKPAVGASFEAAFDKLYASITMASVKLPTDPSSEISFAAGLRPKLGNVDLDLAWTFYSYPNESWWLLGPTGGTDYWEASARAEMQVTDALRVGGGYAWSPNVSNTGAPGQYFAVGLSYDLPRTALPNGISVSVSGSLGYSRFGDMDDVLGGYPLPSYLNWNAGTTFTWKTVSLDLRYYDTNLSQEDCYVFTGATDAVGGGATDAVRNPEGLRSRWCGAAVVAKLVFATN